MASLTARITALGNRIAQQFNTIKPRLQPAGGTTGQVLTKTGAADYASAWQTPAAGGGGGLTEAQVTNIARQAVFRYR